MSADRSCLVASPFVEAMPQARIGDMHMCVGPPGTMVLGSPTVPVGGVPACRVGDSAAHGGVVVGPGSPTVLIG
jgi:uncharacterized Zn-binding protein involved in type VI secretion